MKLIKIIYMLIKLNVWIVRFCYLNEEYNFIDLILWN